LIGAVAGEAAPAAQLLKQVIVEAQRDARGLADRGPDSIRHPAQ
jgi:hypothetical protein